MVKIKEMSIRHPDGSIDLEAWFKKIQGQYQLTDIDLIKQACELAQATSKGLTTFYGQPCLEQGLEMAEMTLDLKLDPIAAASAIILSTTQHAHLPVEQIEKHLGHNISKLVDDILKLNFINTLNLSLEMRDQTQLDRLRKILLAMASDIRAVVIKLAERTVLMRGIKNINPNERKRLAQETMNIYAPLANRLGIGQLKWELEDLSFHYLDPEAYKSIANFLSEKRIDRDKRIKETINRLKCELENAHISASVSGRAKHIYSIHRKQYNKQLDYKNIFDYSAARILVPTIPDCFTALSLVHRIWDPIPEEFDDYISRPKPNGYRSIHTAVIGSDKKNIEIQIRTYEMHELAEHGVAAHWLYKENHKKTGYEDKITYLRQLLQWQQDLSTKTDTTRHDEPAEVFADRVYAFTPGGDIIDLPLGATPLDFAYHIHSELGHRCRGAKINSQIVSLNYALQTGDQVEILTVQQGTPSRDWLNPNVGYLKTSRARAKVSQWFRHQETTQYLDAGKQLLERELSRLGIQNANIHKIATQLNYSSDDAFFISLGHGNIRMSQINHAILAEKKADETPPSMPILKKSPIPSSGVEIAGIDHLLTRIAKCCKPIPGEAIIGYITQGRGISIHRQDCHNLSHLTPEDKNRLIQVSWDNKHTGNYYVDIFIRAYGRENILKEVTNLFSNVKVGLLALNSTLSQKTNMIHITMTIEIQDSSQLNQLMDQIKQLPFVLEAKRISE